jgi:hypothetical protein
MAPEPSVADSTERQNGGKGVALQAQRSLLAEESRQSPLPLHSGWQSSK